MRRREVMIGLALVLVLSMALPAIGASPDRLAQRALKIAKQADKRSKKALREARTQGPPGKPGADGPAGADGAAAKPPTWLSTARGVSRAFGVVGKDGTLNPAKTHNVSKILHPDPGVYCIEITGGIDTDINEIFAVPDFADDDTTAPPSGATAKQAFVEIRSDRADCPTPNHFEVRTFNQVFVDGTLTGNVSADNGFFFVVP